MSQRTLNPSGHPQLGSGKLVMLRPPVGSLAAGSDTDLAFKGSGFISG